MKQKSIKILAIESSCDETAAAIIHMTCNTKHVTSLNIKSNIISSQVKLHAKYGGVYPELASREHIKNILPVIQASLDESRITNNESCMDHRNSKKLTPDTLPLIPDFDVIAVTTGPGLIGSLLVGVNTAKTFAYTLGKPIYSINHMEGHIYANFVSTISNFQFSHLCQGFGGQAISKQIKNCLPQFPLVALIVSGGHTSLVYMKNHLEYQVIGETLDDAAGEAFDKVAKLMNLGYPGGPVISAMAEKKSNDKIPLRPRSGRAMTNQVQNSQPEADLPLAENVLKSNHLKLNKNSKLKIGDFDLKFPRPMINSNDFNFSFSGIKTSVLYAINKLPKPLSSKTKSLICKEFQDAVVETLVSKTLKAARKYKAKSVFLCGGVSANLRLRDEFSKQLSLDFARDRSAINQQPRFFVPEKSLCTDNAAMIGVAAAYRIALGKKPTPWYNVNADSNQKL
jgi:N6-L-threonylcarbamoyladenine synthase